MYQTYDLLIQPTNLKWNANKLPAAGLLTSIEKANISKLPAVGLLTAQRISNQQSLQSTISNQQSLKSTISEINNLW